MRTLMKDKPMWVQSICYLIFGFIAALSFTMAFFVIKDLVNELKDGE